MVIIMLCQSGVDNFHLDLYKQHVTSFEKQLITRILKS